MPSDVPFGDRVVVDGLDCARWSDLALSQPHTLPVTHSVPEHVREAGVHGEPRVLPPRVPGQLQRARQRHGLRGLPPLLLCRCLCAQLPAQHLPLRGLALCGPWLLRQHPQRWEQRFRGLRDPRRRVHAGVPVGLHPQRQPEVSVGARGAERLMLPVAPSGWDPGEVKGGGPPQRAGITSVYDDCKSNGESFWLESLLPGRLELSTWFVGSGPRRSLTPCAHAGLPPSAAGRWGRL